MFNKTNEKNIEEEFLSYLKHYKEVTIEDIDSFFLNLLGDYLSKKERDIFLKKMEEEGKIEAVGKNVRINSETIELKFKNEFLEVYSAKIVLSIRTDQVLTVNIPEIVLGKIRSIKHKLTSTNNRWIINENYLHESNLLNISFILNKQNNIHLNLTNKSVLIESEWKPDIDNVLSLYANRVVGLYGKDYIEIMKLNPLSYSLLIMNILIDIIKEHPRLHNVITIDIDKIEYN